MKAAPHYRSPLFNVDLKSFDRRPLVGQERTSFTSLIAPSHKPSSFASDIESFLDLPTTLSICQLQSSTLNHLRPYNYHLSHQRHLPKTLPTPSPSRSQDSRIPDQAQNLSYSSCLLDCVNYLLHHHRPQSGSQPPWNGLRNFLFDRHEWVDTVQERRVVVYYEIFSGIASVLI